MLHENICVELFSHEKRRDDSMGKHQLYVLGYVPYCSVLPSLPSGISGRLRSNISEFAVP